MLVPHIGVHRPPLCLTQEFWKVKKIRMNSSLSCLLAFVPKWREKICPEVKWRLSFWWAYISPILTINYNSIQTIWLLYCSHQHSYKLEWIATQNKSLSFAGLGDIVIYTWTHLGTIFAMIWYCITQVQESSWVDRSVKGLAGFYIWLVSHKAQFFHINMAKLFTMIWHNW